MALGVVEQVGEHLPHQQMVDVHGGEVVGQVEVDLVAGQQRAHGRGGFAYQVEHRPRHPFHPQHPRLEAGHVEQAGDEARQPVGLDVDELVELVLVGGRHRLGQVEQRRRRQLDGRQRGAQIVGHRAHQRLAEAVGLLAGSPPVALARATALAPRPGPARWRWWGAARGGWRRSPPPPERATRRAGPTATRARMCVAAPGAPVVRCTGAFVPTRRLASSASGTGSPDTATGSSPSGLSTSNVAPARENCWRTASTMVWPKPARGCSERSSSDNSNSRRASAARAPEAARASSRLATTPCHHRHDDDVHAERDPVAGRPHIEGVVGRDEGEVVDEEPGHDAHQSGHEAARDHARHHGDDEHQGRGGDVEVGAQRDHGRP